MGFFGPTTVKKAGTRATDNRRQTLHGSKGDKRVAKLNGGLMKMDSKPGGGWFRTRRRP